MYFLKSKSPIKLIVLFRFYFIYDLLNKAFFSICENNREHILRMLRE